MTTLQPERTDHFPGAEIKLICPSAPHAHTPEEVGPLVGLKPRTLRNLAGRREIACTKVGRELRFTHEQIEAIIRRGQRDAAPPPRIRRDARRHS